MTESEFLELCFLTLVFNAKNEYRTKTEWGLRSIFETKD